MVSHHTRLRRRRPPTAAPHSLVTVCLLVLRASRTGAFTSPHGSVRTAPRPRRPRLARDAAPASSDGELRPGKLVEFVSGGSSSPRATLGAVVEPDGKKNWRVVTSAGRSASVRPRDVRHVVPGSGGVTDGSGVAAHEDAAARALADDAASGGADVAAVWEMLLEDAAEGDAEATDLRTLAELLLGDASSQSCYGARAILTEGAESACFRPSAKIENAFEARPAEVVAALRAKAVAEAEIEAKWQTLRERIATAGTGLVLEDEDEEVRGAFRALERLGCLADLGPEEATAAAKDGGAEVASAQAFLQRLGRKRTAEAARAVLVETGTWHAHQNLDVVRLRVPTDFPPALEAAAAALASSPPPDADADARRDLTHLPAFAIDEATTREIDDALAVEVLPDGRVRLWVHIADPTRFIAPGSDLDDEARRRGTSLYLPTGTVPMFPMALAAGPLCLRPGEVACALSVGVVIDDQGGIDADDPPLITPSLVRTTRLTYRQVDMLIDPFSFQDLHGTEEDGDTEIDHVEDKQQLLECLRRLQWASDKRLQWRKDGGSLESMSSFELPDMSVKAWPSSAEPDGWAVSIQARERGTASRIVTELMLLANEACAAFAADRDIPAPYRSQKLFPISDDELGAAPAGPCRTWEAIRSTSPSVVSAVPAPHDGLGLDVYVQATSPVRRYADLALHRQLKAHLRGDGALPFSAGTGEGGDDIVRLAREGGGVARQLERSANDYWVREFLRRRAGEPVAVTVLAGDRRKRDTYKIFLPELGAIFDFKSSRSLEVGSQIELLSSRTGELMN